MFGYVQLSRGRKLRIERIGAHKEDGHVDNILAFWVSTRPRIRGTVITGWYKEAVVYRSPQDPPANSNRKYKGEVCRFFVKAKAKNCRCLPVLQRDFVIPRGKCGIGQTNVWYADKEKQGRFRKKAIKYVTEGLHQYPT
ncbi:MAG: hypothetical protein AUI92_01340 [Thaumarchaeota archaeon 13_1_40CM_3_38_6]|nr:MAG: hypothetical protein AUI92_01340 [Thaumarchaeota archaeon 13_1_40CM_3_38_6]